MSKKNHKGRISLEKELEDIFSILSSHIEKVENKKTKKIGKKRGRPPKNPCRALIPLDTDKIRLGYLKEYKRRKKVLERLEEQLQRYEESDEPEYRKYLARSFGAEQTLLRELTEQIHLCQNRYEKICFLAHESHMSKERYCFTLRSQLTSKQNFWELLEMELQRFLESGRKTREEEKREYEESVRKLRSAVFGIDEDEDIETNETSEDDDDFEKIFSKLFENLLGEDDGTPDRESEAGDLKKLYRELCLRYHPDRIGTHDAKTQRLWNKIQDAYMNHDLEGLRAIHSGIELESGKTELSCSEIDEMIFDLEWSIQDKRSELRAQKKTPIWGFASWTEQKRKQIAKEIKSEFDQNAQMTRLQLQHLEAELERLLQWKPKEKKRPIPQKKTNAQLRNEKLADIPDLFNL